MEKGISFQRADINVFGRRVLSGDFLLDGEKIGSLKVDYYFANTGGEIQLNYLPEYEKVISNYLPIALGMLGIDSKNNIVEIRKTIIREREIHKRGRVGPIKNK